ncbi:heavy metal-binding domain-containing protein [Flavobacterium flavipallidum]|uniref:Heavy metal-binding domain-containing protein n=1 Tax=Flavobacterium flavipallidum TaxID=3139140 RepID=A0ABU9HHB1_9FLAO
MKKILLLLSLFLAVSVTVVAQTTERSSTKEASKNIYTCPMHPEIKSDQPGKCPKCGMDLVAKKMKEGKHKKMKADKNAKKFCCPMHSSEMSDKPSKCSKCGMDMKAMKSMKDDMGKMKEEMHKDMDSKE